MDNNIKTTNTGMGFFGWLTLIFITLKLTDYVDWSWWWVLSPLLLSLAFVVLLWGFLIIVMSLSKD